MEFNSKDEEISYWKERTENFQNELSIVQEEFHNYQMSSKELEQELELQLDDYEAKNKSLLILNEKLNIELENLQIRVLDSSKIFNSQINLLQEELNRVKSDKFTLQKYVRELEQTNDDLERSLRATVTSLQDFEQQLNIALEKNAILENELDEKEALVETVQRLKDEARDLRQDLQVKDLHMNQFQDSMSQHDKDALATSLIEERNEPYQCHIAIQTDLSFQSNIHLPNFENNYSFFHQLPLSGQCNFARSNYLPTTPITLPLTPAARISALSLVSDMLRKIGCIENKLSLAAQRGLLDNEVLSTPHASRTSVCPRLSTSAVNSGYPRHFDNNCYEGNTKVTPVASPIGAVHG